MNFENKNWRFKIFLLFKTPWIGFLRFPPTCLTEKRLIQSMQLQRARVRLTRPKRFLSAEWAKRPLLTRWKPISRNSVVSRRQSCWWTNRPSVTEVLDLWPLKTRTLLTVFARFISTPSRIRRWSARRPSQRRPCKRPIQQPFWEKGSF